MKCIVLLLVAVLFVISALAAPNPGVHKVTSKLVTRVHRFKIPAGGDDKGRGKPGRGRRRGGKDGRDSCKSQGITGAVGGLDKGVDAATSDVANALGGRKKHLGLLGDIANAAEGLVNDVAGGVVQATSDFFCGFNRVFGKIGSDLGQGNVVGAVLSGADVFVTGAGSFFGNIGKNAIHAVTSGFSDGVHFYHKDKQHY